MQDALYDASARFEKLAEARSTDTGSRLMDAAEGFKEALVAFLMEWEAEYDAGDSMHTPSSFEGIVTLWLASAETAAKARDLNARRNLSYVLATEEAA